MKKANKPPLGLRPYEVVLEERKVEIDEAISRYEKNGMEVPSEWLEELWTIVGQLEEHEETLNEEISCSGKWRSVHEKPYDFSVILFQLIPEDTLRTQKIDLTFRGIYSDMGLPEGYIHVNEDFPGDVGFDGTKVARWIPMHEVLDLIK